MQITQVAKQVGLLLVEAEEFGRTAALHLMFGNLEKAAFLENVAYERKQRAELLKQSPVVKIAAPDYVLPYAKLSAKKERAARFFGKKRRLAGEFPVTATELRKLNARRTAEQLAQIKQLEGAW